MLLPLLSQLFLHLATGGLVVLVFIASYEALTGFLSFMSLVGGVFLILGLALDFRISPTFFLFALTALLTFAHRFSLRSLPVMSAHRLLVFAALTGILATAVGGAAIPTHGSSPLQRFFSLLASLLSSGVLGGVGFSMVLGHWYLVVPRLSIEPLKRTSKFFIGALIARIVLLILTLLILWNAGGSHVVRDLWLASGAFPTLLLWSRLLLGLIIPAVFLYLIWGTVKIRSTQEATGILYVTTALILLGELVSKYLSVVYALPL
ncbi:MAG: hypothetical protein HY709_07025 [Candidatus Latescibacteria bacterium]|nr:hypothetical protein [Candidatus Latescibacterota bacterium]